MSAYRPTTRKLQERRIRWSLGVSRSQAALIASLAYGVRS